MVLLWNTTGEIEVLESFASPKNIYSMSIFINDSETGSILASKSMVHVPSTKTPLVQFIPSSFELSNRKVNVVVVDNTYYSDQDPLELYIQYDEKKPLVMYFSSRQDQNNLIMRKATVYNIPYKNIQIFFKNM